MALSYMTDEEYAEHMERERERMEAPTGEDDDDGLACLNVGDQFWAASSASRTPYEVTAIGHSPGAHDHLWAVITARQLLEASKPFDEMPLVSASKHEAEITLWRRKR